MSDQYGGEVRYTVKELLEQMRQEQGHAHREQMAKLDGVKRDVREISKRVDQLEDDRIRRSTVSALGGKVWVALGVIVNIPAMLYFLTGAH